MAARNPARVLPEPVGAQTSACRPPTIAGQPPDWASVGPSGNRRSNHARSAGWNRSRALAASGAAAATGIELTEVIASHAAASPVRAPLVSPPALVAPFRSLTGRRTLSRV